MPDKVRKEDITKKPKTGTETNTTKMKKIFAQAPLT
jgi:hypothetical protein